MILCLRACMLLLSSSTTGLLSLLSAISLSRFSFRALYWFICPSTAASLMPVPEGMRSRLFVGSVRYSLMNRASFSWVSCSSASAL